MATIDDLVTQGSVMPDNLRSDTARASLEYKNQLKNAGDIYVGTGTKITNKEDGVSKEIYVTEGKNIQKALNEDIFRVGGKSNVNLSSSTLGAQSQYNVLIGSGASINGSSKNVVIGCGAQISSPFDNSIAIGNNANVNASGIAIGDSTRAIGTNGVVIGDEAQNASTKGIAIGYKAKANTLSSGAIAIGDTAVSAAENAVQIGTGTNSVANTLKFRDTQIVDGDGSVNATKINGVLSTDIFESDKKTVKNATNVTGTIDGRLISSIFSGDTSIVQQAARLDVGRLGYESMPVYFENGVPRECKTQILTVGSGRPFPGSPYAPGDNKVYLGSWDLFLSDYYYSITAIMATIDSNGKDTDVTKYEDWFSVSDLANGRNKVITYKSKLYTLKVDNGELVFEGPADTIEFATRAERKYPIKCIRVFEIN